MSVFWGRDVWAESCHYFYYTKFGGLIIVFGAMEFSGASLQRFWLMNLKDFEESDLGVSDLLREWSSLIWFSALLSLLPVFLWQEQEGRWSCCWPLGCASKQPEHLPALQVGFQLGHRTWLTDGMHAQSLKSPATPQVWPTGCFPWNGHHVQRPADHSLDLSPRILGPGYRVKDHSCWPKPVFPECHF